MYPNQKQIHTRGNELLFSLSNPAISFRLYLFCSLFFAATTTLLRWNFVTEVEILVSCTLRGCDIITRYEKFTENVFDTSPIAIGYMLHKIVHYNENVKNVL